MTHDMSVPMPEPFIIAGPAADLQSVLRSLTTDPETSVLSVHNDSTDTPDRLVASMSAERAAALGRAFPMIIIEPDRPLTFD